MLHQLLQAPAILGFQGLLNMHELVEVVLILNVHAQVMVLGEQLAYPGQAFGDHIEDRAVVGPRQPCGSSPIFSPARARFRRRQRCDRP